MATPYIDPLTRRAKDSEAMVPYWDKVDAIIDGIDAMRAAGEMFLPKFTKEGADGYRFRKTQTKMTNVYRDIIEGLASKPFEQSVQLIGDNDAAAVPSEIETFQWDVDGSGNNMTVFAANTFFNGINSAIDWIWVDYDKPDPNVRTVADQRASGRRPYWSHVLGRNVLEARSMMIAGKEVLTYARILEPGDPDHVRVFERMSDGTVTWELYQRTDRIVPDRDSYFARVDGGTISIGEIPLIPFVTGRRDGRSWRVFPALQDAADLQVELYQQESGLKFAKTLTAFPMLAANGMKPPMKDGKPVTDIDVGPNVILWGQSDGNGNYGSWSYVEPNAESLKFLAEDIKSTIQNLRELGRQPLTASSSNITVITAAVAAGKAKSAVKAWAYGLKDALENALKMTAKFMGITYDPMVHVFVDFDDWMEGEDIDAIVTLNEKGKLSDETTWEELTRRGVLSTNFTADRERDRIEAEGLARVPASGDIA